MMEQSNFNSDLITKDSPRIIDFFRSIDKTLDGIERLIKGQKPLFGGERFYTEKEIADKLHISRRTLFEWRNSGQLPYIQIGGKILYRQSDVQKSLEKKLVNTVKK